MFDLQVTCMGWQGWMIETARTSVGIDLLLVADVGRGPAPTRLQCLFPHAREFRWEAFPRLDAYVLTHEHEDHFNIPSLARLDRSIPVYLSSGASTAATAILDEMGFRSVHLVSDGQTVALGDIELDFFGNTAIEPGEDEWDTLAFLARAPGGTFFTPVDAWLSAAMRQALDRRAAAIGRAGQILCSVDLSVSLWPPPGLEELEQKRRLPDGIPFTGNFDACLGALRSGSSVQLHAGMTARMTGHRLSGVGASDYLSSSLEVLPARRPLLKRPEDDLAPPLTGEPALSAAEREELERYLKEIADHLYGRDLHRALVRLGCPAATRPTFALLLRTEPGALVYEYHMQACDFRLIDGSPDELGRYAGAVHMWARDLLSLGRGLVEPRVLGHHISETWRAVSHSFWQELWFFYHPLRFPERVLHQYRRILREVEGEPPIVRWAARAGGPALSSAAAAVSRPGAGRRG